MVSLFPDWERDWEPIARRRERARGKWRVGAWRILKVIEIENKFARFVEAVGWQPGVEKAAGGIRRPGAGGIAQDEK